MFGRLLKSSRPQATGLRRRRRAAIESEALESRLLLYSTLGDAWTYSSRITFSFMPDGTSIGGVPSSLFSTLNAIAPTATWEAQIEEAAALWEQAANLNLSLVSDNGAPVGSSGDQQGDPNFGDIRIGMAPLGSGTLAMTFLPPPANGGTDAGDIIFNSQVPWSITSDYNLYTVAAHEFGHALGLGDSTYSTAVMYGTYDGIKNSLTSDDIAGIQSIYGAPAFDQFNQNGVRNNFYNVATNVNSYFNSADQISLPGLNLTTYPGQEWFYVNAPSNTSGQMIVTVQASNLSLFSPQMWIYNQSLHLIADVSAPLSLGGTISYTLEGVTPGEGFYVRVTSSGTPATIGTYGLQFNFGYQSQAPIPPPYTTVPSQPDQGFPVSTSSTMDLAAGSPGGSGPGNSQYVQLGTLRDWADLYLPPAGVSFGNQGSRLHVASSPVPLVVESTGLPGSATVPVAMGPVTTSTTTTTTSSTSSTKTRSAGSTHFVTPPPARPPVLYGTVDTHVRFHKPISRPPGFHPFEVEHHRHW